MPVANEKERQNLFFLLSKETSYNLSENHLWYSIFTRPNASRNRFTRVQRVISCFVLLYLSMLLSILYYNQDLKSTSTLTMNIGSIQFSLEQVIVGIIVELLALLPSLMIVQLFRRTRSRQDRLTKHTFPWWFLLINYALCFIIVTVSIFFIIARGIEFGDDKTQKWLISTACGFFSSILLTQPLKVSSFCSVSKTEQ